jgi:osmotically-inducible protein OsmY
MNRVLRDRGAAATDADVLATNIERSVQERTGRRIRDLRVEVDTRTVRLHGRCSSYYSKQLAQQAVMDVAGDFTLANEIEVA